MLNPQILAQHVKFMISTGPAFTRGKQSIGELFSVVGEQSGNLDRTDLVQGIQETAGARLTLVHFICTNTQRVARSIATKK